MQQIGVVSEDHRFLENRTGRQNAELLGLLYENFDMERFEAALKEMQISGGVTYKKMSRGERMKFQLAFAIAHGSRLYLLDEATAGLDPVFRIEFFDMLRSLLRDENCSVLMTSHNEAEITRQTDYVAVMKDGRLSAFQESIEGIHYDKI
jgi:ABC-2 type transport system ATP-binding protein